MLGGFRKDKLSGYPFPGTRNVIYDTIIPLAKRFTVPVGVLVMPALRAVHLSAGSS